MKIGIPTKGSESAAILSFALIALIVIHNGSCQNTRELQQSDNSTHVQWLEWQPWHCWKQNHGCLRERNRECVTGNPTDCLIRTHGHLHASVELHFCDHNQCPVSEIQCKDEHAYCDDYDLRTLVCADYDMALQHCPRGCGLCSPKLTCKDDPTFCTKPDLLTIICQDNTLAKIHCPLACGLCQPSTTKQSTIYAPTTTQTTTHAPTTTQTTTHAPTTTQTTTHAPTTTKTTTHAPTTTQTTTHAPTTTQTTAHEQTTTQKTTPTPTTTHTTTHSPTTTQTTTHAPTTTQTTAHAPTTTQTTTHASTSTQTTTHAPTTTQTTTHASTSTQTTTHEPSATQKPTQQGGNTKPVQCAVCSGPPQLCAKIYRTSQCDPPNNYCINHIVNDNFGGKMVNRTCGTFGTCYREWFQGSSDNERCQKFDANQVVTTQFECTFCCVQNNCNVPLKPAKASLYNDT